MARTTSIKKKKKDSKTKKHTKTKRKKMSYSTAYDAAAYATQEDIGALAPAPSFAPSCGGAAPPNFARGFAAPGFAAPPPGFGAPLAAPGFAPGFGLAAPGFAPGFAPQGFAAPGFAAPGVFAPGFAAPGLMAPGFAAPGMVAPGLAAPGLMAPGMVAPGLAAPASACGLAAQRGMPQGMTQAQTQAQQQNDDNEPSTSQIYMLDSSDGRLRYLSDDNGKLALSPNKELWTVQTTGETSTLQAMSSGRYLTSNGIGTTAEQLRLTPLAAINLDLYEIFTANGQKVLQSNLQFGDVTGAGRVLDLVFGTPDGCDTCPELIVLRNHPVKPRCVLL